MTRREITPERAERAEQQYIRLLCILRLGFIIIKDGHRIKGINPEGVERVVPLTYGQRSERETKAKELAKKYHLK